MSEVLSDTYLEGICGTRLIRFDLSPDAICQIGRESQNTIVLDDNQVSRRHALVQCGPGGTYQVADLGSRNGTWLNGRRVTALVPLRNGDTLTIGGTTLRFQGPAAKTAQDSRQDEAQCQTVAEFLQRLITVLVIDIRDFTGLSQALGEAKLSEVVTEFMRQSGSVLTDHGTWAQKHIGDAVMGVWLHADGRATPGSIILVLEAANKIFAVAEGMQSAFDLPAPLRVGAGINTGMASIGNMGSEAASDYTAVSDTVNFAFRLESATKLLECDIALGESTHAILAGVPGMAGRLEPREATLKGYREPKPIFAATRKTLEETIEILRRGTTEEPDADRMTPPTETRP